MGLNFGVVTGIDEITINLKELVQDGQGEWVERASALQLLEIRK
jgi:type IV pilus assembly protein PilP